MLREIREIREITQEFYSEILCDDITKVHVIRVCCGGELEADFNYSLFPAKDDEDL